MHRPTSRRARSPLGAKKWVEEGSEYRARHGGRPSGKRDDNRAYGEKKSFGDRKPYGEKKSYDDRKSSWWRRSPMATASPTSAATVMIAARKWPTSVRHRPIAIRSTARWLLRP